ncbi:hypothetical protein Lal_00026055, partial [Lupinus albus]
MVWRLKVPEKVKLLCWLGFYEALPSNALRFQRNMTTNHDLMHVFWDYPHSSSLWMRLGWDNSSFWVTQPFRPWVLKNSKR